MSRNTKIDYCDVSWSPVTGCTKVSAGCDICYAQKHTHRMVKSPKTAKYRNGFSVVVTHPSSLEEPSRLKHPSRILVSAMSDLFHKDVPDQFIHDTFAVMNNLQQHTFLLLTKRSERLRLMASSLNWTPNIHAGVSIENSSVLPRLADLKEVPAALRWLSLEPLLGPLPNLNLNGIGWVVVGGETGKGYRPMNADWVRDIRNQCIIAQIPFWFKAWGGRKHDKGGYMLDNQEWDQCPV